MQYVLLLANAPDAWETTSSEAPTGDITINDGMIDDGVFADWATYTRALAEAGVLVGGAALHGPDSATSVRVRQGRRLLTDGPFVETKEHLIGYYVIDVPDLDSAVTWAARVPNVRTGTVEVRPVVSGSTTDDTLAG